MGKTPSEFIDRYWLVYNSKYREYLNDWNTEFRYAFFGPRLGKSVQAYQFLTYSEAVAIRNCCQPLEEWENLPLELRTRFNEAYDCAVAHSVGGGIAAMRPRLEKMLGIAEADRGQKHVLDLLSDVELDLNAEHERAESAETALRSMRRTLIGALGIHAWQGLEHLSDVEFADALANVIRALRGPNADTLPRVANYAVPARFVKYIETWRDGAYSGNEYRGGPEEERAVHGLLAWMVGVITRSQ